MLFRSDPVGLDIFQETLQGRALKGRTRDATIVIHLGQAGPALVFLAEDIGFTRLALGIEGVEVLLQPFFMGLARIDRAADRGVVPPLLGLAVLR